MGWQDGKPVDEAPKPAWMGGTPVDGPSPPPSSDKASPVSDVLGGAAQGAWEGAGSFVGGAIESVAKASSPVQAYHWMTDPTGEWAKLKDRGKSAVEGVESFFSSGATVAGPYGATEKQASSVEKQEQPGVEDFKKKSLREKSRSVAKTGGELIASFAAPELLMVSAAKVSELLSRTDRLNAATQAATAARTATAKDAAGKVLREHPFLGDNALPQTNLERDQSLQALNDRKAAIQNELRAGIAEANRKIRSRSKALIEQGRKDLANLEEKLSSAEARTPEIHQVHENAAQSAGLPKPYTLAGDRPPAGNMARESAGPAHEAAITKQQAGTQPWDAAKKHARTLEQRGEFLETSESGSELLDSLKKTIAGGIDGGSPAVPAGKDVMAGLGGAPAAGAAGTPGVVTADEVLRTTARDLYRGLSGETVDGVHHPVNFEVVYTNIRRLRDIQYSADEMGYGSVARRHARDLADKTVKALENYVGKEHVPIDAYNEASADINRWQSRLGQALTGREDLPYVGKENAPHLTKPSDLPRLITENIEHATQLLGPDNVEKIMEAHVSDELSNFNTSTEAKAWMNSPSNSWIKDVPDLKDKVLKYVAQMQKAEGDIKGLQATAAELKAEIAARPKRIADQVRELRKGRPTPPKESDPYKMAQAQHDAAHTETMTRKSIDKNMESFMNASTPERVSADADKLIDSLKGLPGTTDEQLNAIRTAARAAQEQINAAKTIAEKEEKKKQFAETLKHKMTYVILGSGTTAAIGYAGYKVYH